LDENVYQLGFRFLFEGINDLMAYTKKQIDKILKIRRVHKMGSDAIARKLKQLLSQVTPSSETQNKLPNDITLNSGIEQ